MANATDACDKHTHILEHNANATMKNILVALVAPHTLSLTNKLNEPRRAELTKQKWVQVHKTAGNGDGTRADRGRRKRGTTTIKSQRCRVRVCVCVRSRG